jgi:riboflavin kinase
VKVAPVDVLKHLALRGAVHEAVPLTSRELGRALGISQQSASAKILELLKGGYVTRDLGVKRQRLRLTEKAMEALRREFADYQRIFEIANSISVHGIVVTGLGEGAYYMSLKGYQDQFKEKLWFEPYPGTLNLKIEGRERAKLDVLESSSGINIDGFTDSGRTYGGAKCFLATVHGVEAAVIMPVRTHHTDILEVISMYQLRKRLGLKDGDVVEVNVAL